MTRNLDIIDMLEGEDGYVRLVLKSGGYEFGKPLTIFFDDDENGWQQ